MKRAKHAFCDNTCQASHCRADADQHRQVCCHQLRCPKDSAGSQHLSDIVRDRSRNGCPRNATDASLPDTAEGWLDEFSVFSIYQVLPEIIELWGLNVETQSTAKKNGPEPSGG